MQLIVIGQLFNTDIVSASQHFKHNMTTNANVNPRSPFPTWQTLPTTELQVKLKLIKLRLPQESKMVDIENSCNSGSRIVLVIKNQ